MESNEVANAIRTAEELERIVTIIQNPTQYKIPSCMSNPHRHLQSTLDGGSLRKHDMIEGHEEKNYRAN